MTGSEKLREIVRGAEGTLSELREKIRKRKAWEDSQRGRKTKVLSVSLVAAAGIIVAFTILWYVYGITPIGLLGRL
jgi:Flp pilus assembly protein TadB